MGRLGTLLWNINKDKKEDPQGKEEDRKQKRTNYIEI